MKDRDYGSACFSCAVYLDSGEGHDDVHDSSVGASTGAAGEEFAASATRTDLSSSGPFRYC